MSEPAAEQSWWQEHQSWWIILAIGGVGIIMTAVFVPMILFGGDDPDAVVDQYYAALRDQDCGELEDLMTAEFFSAQHGSEEECERNLEAAAFSGDDLKVDTNEGKVSGSTATVDATLEVEDESGRTEHQFSLVEEGDDWLISGIEWTDEPGE